MAPSSKAVSNPREKTLVILNALNKSSQTLDRVMADVCDAAPGLSKQDRALTNAIVYGVLRWQGRIDWIIRHFSKTPMSKISLDVLNILRIGIFQILYLDRIPNSAAVNTSVELAKKSAPKWVAGFVNGILRNVIRHHEKVAFPDLQKDPVLALATAKSFPSWLIKRWLARFGPEKTAAICDIVNTIPPMTIRVNTLFASGTDCCDSLMEEQINVTETPYSPHGLYLGPLKKNISDLRAFKKGWFQVQDEAAQLVTFLCNPLPGETVLDACAGLGGKTAHMAQLMENRGKIIAVDSSPDKLQCLDTEMKRLGITMVETCLHDLHTPFSKDLTFDRILLDAPCSGLGVLRRNPDTKWNRKQKDLKRYQNRQVAFLANLAALLKPEGKLVYAVCSFEPEENEVVIQSFLQQHPGFEIETHPMGLPGNAAYLVDEAGCLKTYPSPHNTDGFFAVVLNKYSTEKTIS